jgi:hypothetical protein
MKTDTFHSAQLRRSTAVQAANIQHLPVYHDFVDKLVKAKHHLDDDLRFVMAVCSPYAYGDTATVP